MTRSLVTYTDRGARVDATVPERIPYLIIRQARKFHRCQATPPGRSPDCRHIYCGDYYLEALDDHPAGGNPYAGRRYCRYCGTAAFAEILDLGQGPDPEPIPEADRRSLAQLGRDLTRAINADPAMRRLLRGGSR